MIHLLLVTKSSYKPGKTVVFEKTSKEKKVNLGVRSNSLKTVRASGAAASFLLEFFEFLLEVFLSILYQLVSRNFALRFYAERRQLPC